MITKPEELLDCELDWEGEKLTLAELCARPVCVVKPMEVVLRMLARFKIEDAISKPAQYPPRSETGRCFRGVSWKKARSKWNVRVHIGGASSGNLQIVYDKEFKDELYAACCYNLYALKFRGANAVLNWV